MTRIKILVVYPNTNGDNTFRIKLLVFQKIRMGYLLDRVCCMELKTAVLIIGVFNLVSLIILLL